MLVQRVIEKFSLENYHLEIDDSSATANGYLGVIFFVKVVHKEGTLDLVVKAGSQKESQRNFVNIVELFDREIYFYKEILPAMSDFQTERLIKQPFVSVPRCYEAYVGVDGEGLVLENLKAKGFSLWNRLLPMDESHITLVLKEYGRFHAISFAMKDQIPERYKQLTENYNDGFQEFFKRVKAFCNFGKRFRILSEVLSKQGQQSLSDKVNKFIGELSPFMTNSANRDDPHSIILHGDCWTNNMMFRYAVRIVLKKSLNICRYIMNSFRKMFLLLQRYALSIFKSVGLVRQYLILLTSFTPALLKQFWTT